MTYTKPCPFCSLDESRNVLANTFAMAIFDGFPVSPGHSLIIPKRHIASLFDATRDEHTALFDLLAEMRRLLLDPTQPLLPQQTRLQLPDGFNIGINDGQTAGQTVMHLHIHLIPRYAGDQPDPRGGVRWIFPDKAVYWNTLDNQ